MEQFNLEKWLQDKSRKVVTRNNKPVRIICCDKLGDYPIIGCIKYSEDYEDLESYNSNGYKYSFEREDQNDLFFADEEEKLTEFEKVLDVFACNSKLEASNPNYYDWLLKSTALNLLDLARKELLKDLPKWKKSTKILSENPYLAFYPSDSHRELCVNGFEININELFEKLPKEE